ncbi:HSP20 family protein [Mariniphaga anaerophila]|uniref:HSP20 family protein n=1 Tax=Mariniphaga anaerophila TaxID=1484053 RepID=A0A1M5CHZ9_9BACT|nr:Hsp20/alpha crystallin family protein [Mariniphaga anaerophila]SHF54291.1 HSP20 family protein [Mariniphaga anaerophila]
MTLARLSNSWLPAFPSWLDNFFEGNLADWNNSNFAGENSTLPAVNVKETENDFQLEVAAPGLKKDDFKINYNNGRLTISSEKEAKHEEKDGKVNRREFCYQSFQRSFYVPEKAIDADKIEAKYNDGILHVKLPKREELKPKPPKEIKIS